MANKFREKPAVKENSKSKDSNKKVESNVFLKSLRNFISGDYLFSNNLWRSPLWFVMYVVVLILIIVGLKSVPVRKYNEINLLREDLKRITVKHHGTKAQISLITTPEALIKDFTNNNNEYSKIIAEPKVIKIIESNGKNK